MNLKSLTKDEEILSQAEPSLPRHKQPESSNIKEILQLRRIQAQSSSECDSDGCSDNLDTSSAMSAPSVHEGGKVTIHLTIDQGKKTCQKKLIKSTAA